MASIAATATAARVPTLRKSQKKVRAKPRAQISARARAKKILSTDKLAGKSTATAIAVPVRTRKSCRGRLRGKQRAAPKHSPQEAQLPQKLATPPIMWQMDASTLIAGGLCGGSATNEPHEVSKPSIAADRPTRRQVGNVTKVQKKSKRKSKAKAKIRAQGKHQSKKESIASAILCAPSPFRRDQFAVPPPPAVSPGSKLQRKMRAALDTRRLRASRCKPSTANSTVANNECAEEIIARELDELAIMARAAANARATSMGLDKSAVAAICARRARLALPGDSRPSHPPRLLHPPPVCGNAKDRTILQPGGAGGRSGAHTNDDGEQDSEDDYSQSSFEDDDS